MDRQVTLLLVEDDPEIREATSALVREHGFRILAAEDGYEAIRVLVDHQVDLLFTDIAMPGISGVQPARQAKLMRGDLRVLYITGDAAQASGKGILYGKLLQKPA
jgi:CheY-like chemotaxis protein